MNDKRKYLETGITKEKILKMQMLLGKHNKI